MTGIVERLRDYGGEDHAEPGSFHHQICWEAAAEIEHLRHINEELSEDVQTLREFDQAQRDEIERLRHPKIIVGSRKLWEAMGEIVSEAEIEPDNAGLKGAARIAAEQVASTKNVRIRLADCESCLSLSRQNGELRRAYDEMFKRSGEKTVYIAECEDAIGQLQNEIERLRAMQARWTATDHHNMTQATAPKGKT